MDTNPAFPFDFPGDLTIDFTNPFMGPVDSTRDTKFQEPLTPVSNAMSRSSMDSIMSGTENGPMIEDGDDESGPKRRKMRDGREVKGDKRQILLQKNRVAAQKCREKKKKETEGMMQRCEHLERQNERLKRETKILTEETNHLKMLIMGHVSSSPGCVYFNDWIESQAQEVIKKIHPASSAIQRPPAIDTLGRNGSNTSTNSMTSTGLSPQREPSFCFEEESNGQTASWSLQQQSLELMDEPFPVSMAHFTTISPSALQSGDPIDPSLSISLETEVKEGSLSSHGFPGTETPETPEMSPEPIIKIERRESSGPSGVEACQASDMDRSMTQ